MARKTVGYVELEWVCPNCNMKNPGTKKVCGGCGSPMPENVAFQRAQEEKLLDKEKIAQVAAAPDIHCGFCGTRNPADAKTCSQCNADLTAGKKRTSGQVLGGFAPGEAKEIKCPHCGSMNPAAYQYCMKCGGSLAQIATPQPAQTRKPQKLSPLMLALIALAAIVGCGILITLISGLFKKDTITAAVDQLSWQRSISIEQYGPVNNEGWLDEMPVDATIGPCEKRYHHTQDEPAPDSTEVCGTPYVVDQGSGLGEVAQDCQYQVQQDFCSYTVMDWSVVDQVTLDGIDNNAIWPEPALSAQQRIGQKEEIYTIHFSSGGSEYQYQTTDYNLFERASVGSTWALTINGFNDIVSIDPQ